VAQHPFHLAFAVRDLESTRRVDFDFFGNQISAHLGQPARPSAFGQVEGVDVPIPHAGALIQVRYLGRPEEQATMFFLDPSVNAIELKSFRNPAAVFTR
jgi:uncharacterized protein